MKLRLEASPQELAEKGVDLLKALADRLYPHDPVLADQLSKAIKKPRKEPELRHKVLRQLSERSDKKRDKAIAEMNKEILAAVKDHLQMEKSLPQDYTIEMNEKEAFRYEIVKDSLKGIGYTEKDFAEGGKLYGLSTNQLVDLIQEKK